uniref:Uncharacterized protein n=1 Tax=Aegilops tauschii TaxID=37682 RepID=M8BDP6_AEGTA
MVSTLATLGSTSSTSLNFDQKRPHIHPPATMSTGKKAEIWPYVPYSQGSQPYVAGTYDKRAPRRYVRSQEPGYGNVSGQVSRQDDQLTHMFNDDNAKLLRRHVM